jgi:protein RecA
MAKGKLNYEGLSIQDALALIDKTFGSGKAILASNLYNTKVVRIPSGSFALDRAMGGGFAQGHAHMLWADKGAGKTTVAYRAEASFQYHYPERMVIHIAIEPFDPENAKSNGVDLSRVIVIYPDYGEEALDMVEVLLTTGQVSLFVVDSVDVLISKAEAEGSMEDKQRGDQARLINKMLRKMMKYMRPKIDKASGLVKYENGLTVIYISQMRINQNAGMFADPASIGGGKGYRHAQSIILKFTEISKDYKHFKELPSGKRIMAGVRIRTNTTYNKTYPPDIGAAFDYYFSDYSDTKRNVRRDFTAGQVDHSREVLDGILDLRIASGDEKSITIDGVKTPTHTFLADLDKKPLRRLKYMKAICKASSPKIQTNQLRYYADANSPIFKTASPLSLGQKRKRSKGTQNTNVSKRRKRSN